MMSITTKYDLCSNCYNRLFKIKKNLVSARNIIRLSLSNPNGICYICKNIFKNLECYVDKIFEVAKYYEFSTFSIGLIIKPSMIDRDDDIRSKFKLIGTYGLKYNLNREISKLFSRKIKSKADISPDLVITLDFRKNVLLTRSKTIYIYGKYVKKSRSIQQKQIVCITCNGTGCKLCNYTGISESNSIGGKIIKLLHNNFISTAIKINYVGGEDKSSLVLGNGRPFFAKIINPKIRNTALPKLDDKKMKIHDLHIIKHMPSKIAFKSKVKIKILTEKIIHCDDLNILSSLKSIKFYGVDNNENVKIIHSLDWKLLTNTTFYILMIVDGGFPIKKFINDNSITPNLSYLIQNTCKCINYDYYEITMML